MFYDMYCDMTRMYCFIMSLVAMMYCVMYLYHQKHQYDVLNEMRHPIDAQFGIQHA